LHEASREEVSPNAHLGSLRIKSTPAAILGRIKAPDAESAVKEWIEKFGITDREQQQRLWRGR
jgi:hypothetical protein